MLNVFLLVSHLFCAFSIGEAIPLDELPLGEREVESWITWGRRVFIAAPTRFAWSRVKQALGLNNIQSKVFVNTKLLQV